MKTCSIFTAMLALAPCVWALTIADGDQKKDTIPPGTRFRATITKIDGTNIKVGERVAAIRRPKA